MQITPIEHPANKWHSYREPLPNTTFPHQKILLQLTWVLVAVGVGLRLFHYFDNRSLWTDEIYLSVSLIRMNYLELMAPALDYEQKAPIGFLWLVRTAILFFGKGEMALRLVPLLAGIASLFLFVPLCRHFLKPLGVVVAVGIMALAPPLIYHSVEIKQYGFDLFVTILAFHLYFRYRELYDLKSLLFWGIAGALLFWFSFTSVFVLPGIAIGVGITLLLQKNWPALFKAMIPFSMWLVSFAVNYLLFTHKHSDSGWLVSFFKYYGGFMPFPPTSSADVNWFVQTPYKMFYYPLGLLWNASTIESPVLRALLKLPVLGILFLLVGIVSFFRCNKQWFWILTAPLLLHLVASAIQLYPFSERFIVYAAPILLLFIGRGAERLTVLLPQKWNWRYALPLLVFAGPLAGSAMQLSNRSYFGGYKHSTQREGLLFVNQQYKPGDVIYIYWNAVHSYKYYKSAYNLKYDAVLGRDHRKEVASTNEYLSKLAADFGPLRGKRVWVVYNNSLDIDIGDDITQLPKWYTEEVKGGTRMRAAVGSMGKELQHHSTKDVNVSLFEL